MKSRTQSDIQLLAVLLIIDLVIAVASWYIPAQLSYARLGVAGVQLVMLILTGLVNLRFAIRAL